MRLFSSLLTAHCLLLCLLLSPKRHLTSPSASLLDSEARKIVCRKVIWNASSTSRQDSVDRFWPRVDTVFFRDASRGSPFLHGLAAANQSRNPSSPRGLGATLGRAKRNHLPTRAPLGTRPPSLVPFFPRPLLPFRVTACHRVTAHAPQSVQRSVS